MASPRTYDVIVYGATGFTGRLTAEYLARASKHRPLRWAIAGRNQAKLEKIKDALISIDARCRDVAMLEARSDDLDSLVQMARQTEVIATTVGPYALHGELLVAACVQARTHYVDITGEPHFVGEMIKRYHNEARDLGLRIVNCCGFDSIPHDLGVQFAVAQLPHGEAVRIEAFVQASGTFSGGTWQSALAAASQLRETRAGSKPLAQEPPATNGRSVHGIKPSIRYERSLGAWACPLPTIDPQMVLRSARFLDEYGPAFSYGHYARVRSGLVLAATVGTLGAVVALAQVPTTRKLLERVRGSGDGPSETQRAHARFNVTFRGISAGKTVTTEVTGGDPGYDETAKMLAESAMCLAFDRDRLPDQAGVLTPAVAMGSILRARLQAAGIGFRVVDRG